MLSLLLALSHAQAQDIDGYSVAVSLKGNVVLVNTDKSAGFGFITAVRSGKAYVVTAKHVVDGASSVSLTFYETFDQPMPATKYNLELEGHDVALLSATLPYGHKWNNTCYSEKTDVGTATWFIGRNSDWYIPTGPAVGSINRLGAAGRIFLDQTSIIPGTSGAPLVTKNGIVGMIIEDKMGGEAVALTIKTLRELIVDEWRYPFDLKQFSPSLDKNLFAGGLELSSLASYGGSPYCEYTMRNEKLKVQVKLSKDRANVEFAIVSFEAHERANEGCPYQTVPVNTHTYTLSNAQVTGNKVVIKFTGNRANNPQCNLTLEGTIVDDKIIAKIVNLRADQAPPLSYKITMDVQLEANGN